MRSGSSRERQRVAIMTRDETILHAGNTVYIHHRRDIVMYSEIRQLVYSRVPLTLIKLTKGERAYLRDSEGEFYSVPPSTIELYPDADYNAHRARIIAEDG